LVTNAKKNETSFALVSEFLIAASDSISWESCEKLSGAFLQYEAPSGL